MLVEAGCDAVQGFLIGKPAPEDEVAQLIGLGAEEAATPPA